MKINIDLLHQLIHSLSKSEKRYFKINASRHVLGESNKYVMLFDAIERQKEYDEDAIIKKFKGEKFLKRLIVAKSYLYDSIIKSMTQYHATQTVANQIIEQLISVSFLYEKGLHQQAAKLLTKIKKFTQNNSQLHLLPIIINWERKIIEAQHFSEIDQNYLAQFIRHTKNTFSQLNHINEYWDLQAHLYLEHNAKGIVHNRKDLDNLDRIFESPLMKNEDIADSFEAKVLHYKIFATYFFVIRDFHSSYRYTQMMIKYIEHHPDMIKAEPRIYINALMNHLNLADVLADYDIHYNTLSKLKSLQEETTSDTQLMQLYEGYCYHSVKQKLSLKDYSNIKPLIKEVEDGLILYKGKLNAVSYQMLCFHVFKLLYEAGKKIEANSWLQRTLDTHFESGRKDIFTFGSIISVILAYEITPEKLPAAIRSSYRFLRKNNNSNLFESKIIRFYKEIIHLPLNTPATPIFVKLLDDIQDIIKDPFERKVLSYFNFEQWLQNQIDAK